jgi:hypothetical protein
VSTEQESGRERVRPDADAATEAPAPDEVPKLRRRPFGYSKRDVREALDRQSAALEARDGELAELRQDIAALWLAFAQHDRMIRRVLGHDGEAATGPAPARVSPAGDEAAIGRQVSDLDDVLAAIELATQKLERSYVAEAGRPSEEPGEAGAGKPAG